MARVFISHSSRDKEPAERIKAWLRDQGFEAPFLDFDKHSGIPPGADWEKTLYREIERSGAVIIIQTPNWFDSKWCFAEFTQARALGKAIFPIIETPTGDTLVSSDIQALDLLKDREGGLEQLSRELTRIALDAQGGFSWDASRPPYPGLLAFQEEDAAIYFGRDDDIRRLIERLNARRAQGGTKLIALLGASGSGKSSLLRAGVIPRIRRDRRNWIVLPPMRPQTRPVDELARAIAVALSDGSDWRWWRDGLSGPYMGRTLSELASDLRMRSGANEAQILIPIDQAEELFGTADSVEADRFMEILNFALSEELPYLAVLAQRSDYLPKLQAAERLAARFEEFSLPPLPLARVPQIIEGPARVAGLRIEEGLVLQASKDAETEDALPLLAFALRELYDRYAGDGQLSLADYHALGDPKDGLTPLENAVRKTADEVLADIEPTEDQLTALRDAFVPAMVQVNDRGEYARRPALWDNLPAKAHPILEHLVKARLLVTGEGDGSRTVEVAHEALLRKWPRLRAWLDEAREFLSGRQQLERDLHDWRQAAEADKPGALLVGIKLNRARVWLHERPHQLSAEERAFILASIDHTEAEERRKARLRRNIMWGSIAAALLLAVASGYAFVQERRAVAALAVGAETAENMVVDFARAFRDQEGVSADLVSQILDKALALQRRLTELGGNSPDLQNGISLALSEAAQTYLQTGASDATSGVSAAREVADEARRIAATLVVDNPDNPEWRESLILAERALGDAQFRLGEHGAALDSYRDSLANAGELTTRDPQSFAFRRELALSHNRVADGLARTGNDEEALEHYESSLEIRTSLIGEIRGNPAREAEVILLVRDLAISHAKVGDLHQKDGRNDEAIAGYEKSQELRRELVRLAPTNTQYKRDLAAGFQRLGALEFGFGNFKGALGRFESAMQIQQDLYALDLSRLDWRYDLSTAEENVADALLGQGRLAEARSMLQQALTIREGLVATDPDNYDWNRSLSVAALRIGIVENLEGNPEGARGNLLRSLKISEALALQSPDDVQLRLYKALALIELAETGDDPEARRARALGIVRGLESEGKLPTQLPAKIEQLLQASANSKN